MNQVVDFKEEIFELKEQLFQEQWKNSQLNTKCNALMEEIERLRKALKEIYQLSSYYIDDASINAIAKQALEGEQ